MGDRCGSEAGADASAPLESDVSVESMEDRDGNGRCRPPGLDTEGEVDGYSERWTVSTR
jgi:hypothetical protein